MQEVTELAEKRGIPPTNWGMLKKITDNMMMLDKEALTKEEALKAICFVFDQIHKFYMGMVVEEKCMREVLESRIIGKCAKIDELEAKIATLVMDRDKDKLSDL